MKIATLIALAVVCAYPQEGRDTSEVQGIYFYKVPIENLTLPPEWFNFALGDTACVNVDEETSWSHCFLGTYVNYEFEESVEFSDLACREGICHND